MKWMVPCVVAAMLGGCASTPPGRVVPTASTPLSDLNLVRTELPPILLEARLHPYALPADTSCAGLLGEIVAFDIVLGPDIDAPGGPENAGAMMGDALVSAVTGAAGALLPFHSWFRRLSGAEQHARDVAAAIGAGVARRAYLKGYSARHSCAGAGPDGV
ncbi:MAG: hypothetical protein V4463_00285 [Pseudomonadota bacterium]